MWKEGPYPRESAGYWWWRWKCVSQSQIKFMHACQCSPQHPQLEQSSFDRDDIFYKVHYILFFRPSWYCSYIGNTKSVVFGIHTFLLHLIFFSILDFFDMSMICQWLLDYNAISSVHCEAIILWLVPMTSGNNGWQRRFGLDAQREGVVGQGSAHPLISPLSNTMAIQVQAQRGGEAKGRESRLANVAIWQPRVPDPAQP